MTLTQILTESFPGQQWTLRAERGATPEEQYAGLEWIGPAKKPTLAEILAAELTDEQRAARTKQAARTDTVSSLAAPDKHAVAFRALAVVLNAELNAIRTAIGLPTRTVPQAMAAFQSVIESGAAD